MFHATAVDTVRKRYSRYMGSTEIMAKSHLKLVAPTTENRTVAMPTRKPNAELRTREYLTDAEVESLIEAAKGNRYGHRDATMILMAYRHGLRVERAGGLALGSDRLRQRHPGRPSGQAGQPEHTPHPWVTNCGPCAGCSGSRSPSHPSCSRRNAARPSPQQALLGLVERAGAAAGLGFKAHPHMLRHACGFALANKGHDTRALQAYLGHKNIQHTVRYTELSPDRFKDFWRK